MSMQKQTFASVLVAGAILGFGAAEMIHAQVPGYATKVLMKTDLQNLPGQEAIFYASDWPPGFRLPWHVHQEGHEFVYVIEGEQTFEIEGVGGQSLDPRMPIRLNRNNRDIKSRY
jgi:quercetin dioxygenase-like cupin family protein